MHCSAIAGFTDSEEVPEESENLIDKSHKPILLMAYAATGLVFFIGILNLNTATVGIADTVTVIVSVTCCGNLYNLNALAAK